MPHLKLNKIIAFFLIALFGAVIGCNGVFAINKNILSSEDPVNSRALNGNINPTASPKVTVSPAATINPAGAAQRSSLGVTATGVPSSTAHPSATGAVRTGFRPIGGHSKGIGTTTLNARKTETTGTGISPTTLRTAHTEVDSEISSSGIGSEETVATVNIVAIDKGDANNTLKSYPNSEKIGSTVTVDAPMVPGWKVDDSMSQSPQTITVQPGENTVTFYYVREVNFEISDIVGISNLRKRVSSGISRQDAALELYRMVPSAYKTTEVTYNFTDVDTTNDTAHTRAIEFLAGHGIAEGVNASVFKPNEKISIKEFNQMTDKLTAQNRRRYF